MDREEISEAICLMRGRHLQELVMEKSTHPSKETIRQWLVERRARRTPLPDLALIRQQLGWMRTAPMPPSGHLNNH